MLSRALERHTWRTTTTRAAATVTVAVAGEIDSFAARFASDAEWWPLRSATEGPYRGPAGVRDWFGDTEAPFDYIQAELGEVEVRGDSVVATGRLKARGKGSGATVELPITWVFRLDGEKVVSGRAYAERDQALADITTS
jgi:ketosteroid isomerase-like protein